VHARAEGGQHHGAPVAELVEKRLDDEALIARQLGGDFALIVDVVEKILRRLLIEAALILEQCCGLVAWRPQKLP
jgi:hypothetical protein